MPESVQQIMDEVLFDPIKRVEGLLTIPDKHYRVVDFKLWPNQRDFVTRASAEGHSRRRVHLKPRQIGESAIIVAHNAMDAMTTPNFTVLVIAQDGPTLKLFRAHYKQHLADLKRVGLAPVVGEDNADMLEFPQLGSRILFETAEGEGVGRAWTVNRLHCTEVAHWQHPVETMTGALQSVPVDGEVDIESTPNGAGGVFHNVVKAAGGGRSASIGGEWELFFYPWWETAEYISDKDDPIPDLSQQEKYLMATHGLTYAHIHWRRMKAAELALTDKPFEQEYPEDPITCFAAGAKSPFSMKVIQRLLRDSRVPIDKGLPPRDGEDFRRYSNHLWIWKEPLPGRQYLIPADISEGCGEDFFAAPVLDYLTNEVVAAYYDDMVDPVEAAEILVRVGRYYNNALLAPETWPGIGYATGKDLENKHNYGNLYYGIDPRRPEYVGDVGWRTDARTRPMMQSALMEHIPSGSLMLWDKRGLQELVSLVWVRKGEGSRPRLEAMPGEHDDYAMALGIGLNVREFQPPVTNPERTNPVQMRPDVLY